MDVTRNHRIRHLLLLVILGIAATHLIVISYFNSYSYSISKITGLLFFSFVYALNGLNFRLSVITCGLFLLCGWFGLVTLSSISKQVSFSFIVAEQSIPVVNGQPLLLVGLIYHFISMRDYYFGILTRDYWKDVWRKNNNPDQL